MTIKKPELQKALRSCVKSWISIIKEEVKSNPSPFTKGPNRGLNFSILLSRIKERLENNPKYKICMNLISSDSHILKHDKTLVGSAGSRTRFEKEQIPSRMLWELLMYNDSFDYKVQEFNRLYASFERDLYESKIQFTHTQLLGGLKDIRTPLKLKSGVIIDKLTQKDQDIFYIFGLPTQFEWFVPKYVIKVSYFLKKVIGDSETIDSAMQKRNLEEYMHKSKVATQEAEDVICVLRVFKAGKIFPLGSISTSDSLFYTGSTGSGTSKLNRISDYSISNKELNKFKQLWKSFQDFKNTKKRKSLNIAFKRYKYAGEKELPEDRFLDLMISAEALFLPNTKSELGFKFALRSAKFLERNQDKQYYLFDFMKIAYDLRSEIVHGESRKNIKLGGNDISFEYFINKFEELISKSLKKAIELVTRGENLDDKYWNNLVI